MKHQPSTMSHNFSQVPHANVRRSSFDRSRSFKTTFDSGYLIPWMVDEVLPGDTFKISPTFFARLATPIKPVMDNLWLDWMVFFVPNRLVWDNWQKQMGEQRNPGDSTDFVTPQMVAPVGGYANQTVQDYMGLPTLVAGYSHNALPLRGYNLIYNEWFRDENLQNSVTTDVGNGPDTVTNYVLKRRGKRHDYFTSSLPSPQKGPAVQLPLGSVAPITGIGIYDGSTPDVAGANVRQTDGTGTIVYANSFNTADSPQVLFKAASGALNAFPEIYADLSAATSATINALRQATTVQQLFETDSRGGTRYTEILKAHFGVTSPDSRLQRPEFLGGGSARVNISPVAQTTPDSSTPQGNLAGFGTVSASGTVVKSFVEHGFIIAVCSVRADLNYQQGLHRMWSRNTRLDYFWPTFQNIGEQAVLLQEIYCTGTSTDDDVFGYQERYAEYRYSPNLITGKFRSNDPQSLDIWHYAQEFGSAPALNATFIEENPPVERTVAVQNEPEFLMDVWTSVTNARPMPMYSVPGLTRF